MNTKPRTLRATIVRSLTVGIFLWVAVASFVGARALAGGFDMAPPASDNDVMGIRPNAEGSPAAMAEEHNCWTGAAPADMEGKMPGHVLVTKPNGQRVVGGPAMVSKALAQVFDGADHGLSVYAFCR